MQTYNQVFELLRSVVQDSTTLSGRLFDTIIIIIILCSLFIIAIETIPGLQPETIYWLELFETVVTLIFVTEYGLRILTAPKKKEYIFSFYGIVDLLAIAPFFLFFLPLGNEVLAVRAVRILRIFRVVKLTRYADAMFRLGRALRASKEEAELFVVATVILLFLASVGIYYFEHEAQPESFSSIPQSLWWAVCTLTTVGYGDVYPITVGGKLFTFLILMCGLGVIAVPAGLIASALHEIRAEEISKPSTQKIDEGAASSTEEGVIGDK